MRFLSDARRVSLLRKTMMGQALLDARDKAGQAAALLERAKGLRDGVGDGAALQIEEHGLTRATLFDRLRMLAVARAHAIETRRHAATLEASATALQEEEAELRRQAAQHQRKHHKLATWVELTETRRRRLRERRIEQLTQEDYACRTRSDL